MRRHPWQAALAILGIAMGVGVVVAIDLANQSATRAFELAMDRVSGKATHRVTAGAPGVPESLYTRIRLEIAGNGAAPVVSGYARTPGDQPRTLRVLGIDPLAEGPFRNFTSQYSEGAPNALLSYPGSALLWAKTARELGVSPGDTLALEAAGFRCTLTLAGTLTEEAGSQSAALADLLIVDIATAQEMLHHNGFLTQIDLILPEGRSGELALEQLGLLLPPSVRVEAVGRRTGTTAQMAEAFRINLTALSFLALIVGMFLIYNTITFSVVQRHPLIGLQRLIGVTREEVFRQVLKEALFLGYIGTLAGLLLGVVIGEGLVKMVSRTINDLYFVVHVTDLNISPWHLLKGFALGIAATLISAFFPARQASGVLPRALLGRSAREDQLRARVPRLTLAGFLCLLAGLAILALPSRAVLISYLGILPIIIGFALLTPGAVRLASRAGVPFLGRIFGLMGRMAARDLDAHISRTAVAVAALAIAVSASVGVGTMVNSFRTTVVHWLESRLSADLYIYAPGVVARQAGNPMPEGFTDAVRQLPHFREVSFFREHFIDLPGGPAQLIASQMSSLGRETLQWKDNIGPQVWNAYDQGAVIISEPMAWKHRKSVGDTLQLPTDLGKKTFEIVGIYYNYASDIGLINISFDIYRRFWRDHRLAGVSGYLAPGVSLDSAKAAVQQLAPPSLDLSLRANRDLLETSIAVFDRTFAITNVLHLLTIGVAFIGIFSALMALQLERRRELGILRANGLTPGQLWGLLSIETGLMGLVSGLLALPAGLALSLALIYVINLRSFGWTLQFRLLPDVLIEALLVAVLAAILAGLYPAWKMTRSSPALALRSE